MRPETFRRSRSRGLRWTIAAAFVIAASAMSAPFPASAQDAPHWAGASFDIDCTSQCHTLHTSPGAALTSDASNVNLCQSCHNSTGLPITDADKAMPGVGGTSHAFAVPAVHALFNTRVPLNTEMALRVMDNNIVCSTCHNQHATSSANGGTPKVSPAQQLTALGSTGSLTSGGTFSGVEGTWYLVEIVTAGNETSAVFHYSKDNGISWFPNLTAGADVGLDSGVTVTFGAGNFTAGERWEFYGSYPFLRAKLDSGDAASIDKFCRDCHAGWEMTHTDIRTWDDTFKSHPVGEMLDANGQGYDRVGAILDGNGAVQGGGGADSNPTNDIQLDGDGRVQCLSCHGVHYADSNTLTVDGP